MTPSADRSTWPAEAIELAEWAELPEDSLYYGAITEEQSRLPYGDSIDLPRLPKGPQAFRWIPAKIHGNGKVYLFAQKWPERECVVESGRDKRDVTLSTAAGPAEAVA